MEEDGMSLACVRAPQDDEVGFLSLAVRRGSSSGSEHCRQTGDAWSVSSPVAAVDVVAVHRGPRELLSHEVHLVGRLGAAENPESIGALGPRRGETGRRSLERLLPRSGTQSPPFSDEGLGQANQTLTHDETIRGRFSPPMPARAEFEGLAFVRDLRSGPVKAAVVGKGETVTARSR